MEIRKSERKQAKIKLALQGSAGSGKTYSSLLLAKGLTKGDFSKIANRGQSGKREKKSFKKPRVMALIPDIARKTLESDYKLSMIMENNEETPNNKVIMLK